VSSPALDTLLGQLNAVPGVIGSMISGDKGQVLAQAFPAQVDAAAPARAAQVLADHAAALPAIEEPLRLRHVLRGCRHGLREQDVGVAGEGDQVKGVARVEGGERVAHGLLGFLDGEPGHGARGVEHEHQFLGRHFGHSHPLGWL